MLKLSTFRLTNRGKDPFDRKVYEYACQSGEKWKSRVYLLSLLFFSIKLSVTLISNTYEKRLTNAANRSSGWITMYITKFKYNKFCVYRVYMCVCILLGYLSLNLSHYISIYNEFLEINSLYNTRHLIINSFLLNLPTNILSARRNI